VTLIWNEAARNPELGLPLVTVASFRGPAKRIDWVLLPDAFRQDLDDCLSWCGGSDPFAADARSRAMAPRTLRLRRDQVHAAVSALVECGTKSATVQSLADLVTPNNVKSILRRRLESVGGEENTFNHGLGKTLVQIAREWVKVDALEQRRKAGPALNRVAAQSGETEGRVPAAKLYSNIYRIFSNYVHAKYPEIMDLYGGRPGRFHLRGMSGTPKDGENLAQLETFVETASNTFVAMIQGLDLRALVESDPTLAAWYKGRFERGY
jgi:hypothetical protein